MQPTRGIPSHSSRPIILLVIYLFRSFPSRFSSLSSLFSLIEKPVGQVSKRGPASGYPTTCRSHQWLREWGTFSIVFLQETGLLMVSVSQNLDGPLDFWKRIFCFFGSFWKILIENFIDWNFIMDKLKPWLTKWLAILLIITAVGESGALKVSVLQFIVLKFVMQIILKTSYVLFQLILHYKFKTYIVLRKS